MKVEEKLFLVRYKVDEDSHIRIRDQDICRERCDDKPCILVCPARVYEWIRGRMAIGYEGCLEDGSCRIVCPFDNIEWRNPRGGFGVAYKFG